MRHNEIQSLYKAVENYPLYSQDGKGMDAKVVAVISYVNHNIHHYILEGSREGNDFIMFGITTGLFETEYGYLSLGEIASMSGTFCTVFREPKPLSEFADKELVEFLNRLYNHK